MSVFICFIMSAVFETLMRCMTAIIFEFKRKVKSRTLINAESLFFTKHFWMLKYKCWIIRYVIHFFKIHIVTVDYFLTCFDGSCRSIEEEEIDVPLPVQQWCRELRCVYEPECCTTLQSKSLTADLSRQVTVMAATTTEAVCSLQHRTRAISAEFTKLYRSVSSNVVFMTRWYLTVKYLGRRMLNTWFE